MVIGKILGVVAVIAIVIGSMSIFTVNEWELAIKFRLGKVVRTDYEPGLHFMTPFVNNVKKFDSRILTLDADPERYLTMEKKNVIVDSFVKWHITDVASYYTSMGGDVSRANLRLSQIIKDLLRGEFGKRTIQEVVSGERAQIMDNLTVASNAEAQKFGISVVDVRLKRIDLAREISDSVYRRMEAERARVAKDLRSKGAEAAERIRADSDRQRTIILAEAYREAEETRGEGDAKSADIYARAYKKDPEFYSFYRSLTAYRESFREPSDLMLIDPESDFFKYFKDAKGGKP